MSYHTLIEIEYEGQIFIRDNTTGGEAVLKSEYIRTLMAVDPATQGVLTGEAAYNLFKQASR